MHRLCRLVGVVIALASFGARGADADLVKRGEYLARAGDCIACHTGPGGKPMAGGLSLPTPLGAVISTNITPSKTHGIGAYTLEQFDAAVRLGVRPDGKRLYPAMPYPSFAKVTHDDVEALYAYFMQAVAPVDASPAPTRLPFPFNIRLEMAAWNLLFLDTQPFQPDPAMSAQWNRGAYLARGLAHCGACHTPRNLLMGEKRSRELGGGEVGVWYAPNITSDATSGIGGWSVQELVDYMRDGHAAGKAQAAGPMAEAIDYSLRHLTEADLQAIAVFVKSVPAVRTTDEARPAYGWGAPADDLERVRGAALPGRLDEMSGPQLYDAYCATCHQARGQGSFDGRLPPLFHNADLGRTRTNNLVMVMLEGVQRHLESRELRMPGFAHELSDVQLATLGTYLTQRYGNPQARVTTEQAKDLRAGGGVSYLVLAAQGALGAVAIVLVAGVVAYLRRRRRA